MAAVDDRLRQEGITSADVAAIGTAALIAMSCRVCKRCYTSRCAWGIATQDSALRARGPGSTLRRQIGG